MDTVLLFNGALPACAPAHHTAAVRHRSAQRTDRGAMQSINMNTQCSTDHPDVWQDGWHAHRHHCWQRCQGMAAARHHGRARPTAAADCTKILACRRVICRRRNKGGGAPHKQSQFEAAHDYFRFVGAEPSEFPRQIPPSALKVVESGFSRIDPFLGLLQS